MQIRNIWIMVLVGITPVSNNFRTSSGCQTKKFTFNQVYRDEAPRLIGDLPKITDWLDEDHYLEVTIDPVDNKQKLVKVNAISGVTTVFVDYPVYNDRLIAGLKLESSLAKTEDYSGYIFNHENDLFYFSTQTKLLKRLTATPANETNPAISPDGRYVAYTRNNDLFVYDLDNGLEYQVTDDGSETIYNGWASWVYYEEIFGRSSGYAAFWWAPNSEMIAFFRFDDSLVPQFPLCQADGVHGKLELQRYPKAGDANPEVKLGIAHFKKGTITWVDTDATIDHYLAWPVWRHDSKQLVFQWVNRGQDNIKIYAADCQTGTTIEIYHEKQEAWVEFFEDFYLCKDGSGFILRTDVDGWGHLYYYDMSGKLKYRLTKGDWSVRRIGRVDEKNQMVYFEGFQEKSVENHLYRVDLKGRKVERLTDTAGSHHCLVAPGGNYFIDTFSSIKEPGIMALYTSNDRKLLRQLGNRKLPAMDDYEPGIVEIFTIPSADGYDLPAMWVLPPGIDKTKKYPVIFSIYGGPGAADVADEFNSRKLLPFHYLAQHGIIGISIDNRGSGHFGKKGMAMMHRHLGKWEMHDLIAAARWLRQLPFIDTSRIGITGGSYGGYTTCMALTYGADYFTHGVAEFSVTDWRLYDTVYTERYMDTPGENPDGYDFASVLTHAEKYKGHLLITHGTMDDNVHMQNTLQLIDRLQELNKDFELMLYPNSRHGYGSGKRSYAIQQHLQFWFRHLLGPDFTVE